MNDRLLDQTEKTKLSDYAREVVARNARAGTAKAASKMLSEPVDPLSSEGLRVRLTALENDFEALSRRMEQHMSILLSTIQRIEARTSKTSGELRAVREELDARAGSASYASDELMAAARDYSSAFNGEITRLFERLEAMNGPIATNTFAEANVPKTRRSSRDGDGAGRDG